MMTQIKAYMASHQELATTLNNIAEITQVILIGLICVGTAPALIWLSQMGY